MVTTMSLRALRWLLLVMVLVPNMVLAQATFQTFPTVDSAPGAITSHTGLIRFGQAIGAFEFGTRVSPPEALLFHRLTPNHGTLKSATIGEYTFNGGPLTALSRVGMRLSLRTKAEFRGAVTITWFVRNPGATTDLYSKTEYMSVGELPAPAVSIPLDNEFLSAAPVFRAGVTPQIAVPVQYQIEVTGPTNKVTTIPVMASGSNFTHYTPLTDGYQPGAYTYRIRALDQRNKPGEWSPVRRFTAYGGIDMAGAGSVSFFTTLRAAGWASFYQALWGGRNTWPDARTNLQRAHNAGFKVAGYVFLNFDNGSTLSGAPANQTGQWQVDRALAGIGFTGNKSSLPYDLKYVMIDLENRYWGTMTPADRVQRIAEACQHIRNLGFWPMIYTRNEGFNPWWNDATDESDDFREMWLWDSKPETQTAAYQDHLSLNVGVPWIRYGGWEDRGGKQYLLDLTVAGGRVDFNVWHPDVWNVNSPNPGAISLQTASLSIIRNADSTYKVSITVRNGGTAEAYAIRLGDATLGGSSVTGRQTLGFIGINGSRAGVYDFAATAGLPGATVPFTYTIWSGNGPQTISTSLTLP